MKTIDRPDWISRMKDLYLSGGASFFILHGNVDDVVCPVEAEDLPAETLADHLARRLFGKYDLVLHYDVGRGLRVHSAGDPQRFARMNAVLNGIMGGPPDWPREASKVLRLLDRLVSLILVGADAKPVKAAFLFDYGELICPPGDYESENLAVFLNWARSPVIKRVNMVFILMTQSLGGLHPMLVRSPYTAELRAPMPGLLERTEFIRRSRTGIDADRLARLSAGLTLSNLDNFLRLAGRRSGEAAGPAREIDGPPESASVSAVFSASPDDKLLSNVKKELIEAQLPGLVEFIEPRLNLDMVAGHTAAKQRLADDARLIREGRFESAPMGYLICGPVGVGKTFLALCYAGTVGIPCLVLRNFRSKYVGETEANLERILSVLRELGPVAVIIDEADAAVGNREASGDSGTSSRVFAQLSAQMGDTAYRGRIVWFLLTCRPDLLPVDLKRQGRCEEHMPLFYPETAEEIREMFLAMARKLGVDLPLDAVPDLENAEPLSGADIESLLTRVRRRAVLEGRAVDRGLIEETVKDFRSARGPDHELQWLAGILECSDLKYLPERVRQVVETGGGFRALTQRFVELKNRLEF